MCNKALRGRSALFPIKKKNGLAKFNCRVHGKKHSETSARQIFSLPNCSLLSNETEKYMSHQNLSKDSLRASLQLTSVEKLAKLIENLCM